MANKSAKTNGTELTEVKSNYIAAGANLATMFTEEMDGLNFSFDRIKVPTGGGLSFEVPGDDADSPDSVKEIKAVILYHHPVHAYFKEKYTGASNPPDCGSIDGHVGIDTESGEVKDCKDCPLNKFGSGENGAKACKQKRNLYILRENEALPLVFSIPSTSLGDFGKYIMRLLSKGKKSNMVVTKFTLKKTQSTGGISYSQVVCAVERNLEPNELTAVEGISEQVKRLAGKLELTASEE